MAIHKVAFPTHKRPTTDVPFIRVLMIGLLCTVALFLLLWPLKDYFIRELFIGYNVPKWDRVIFQGIITLVFMLSMATIILKIFRTRRERAIIDQGVVPDQLDATNPEEVRAVYERVVANPRLTESLVLTRVARLLAMWINTGDFGRTTQWAKEESELDAWRSDSSFRANRLFIWALPVLGFLGTVYGVSYSVGGFAEFLRGAVTPEQIKEQVGIITEGLAVAFYTTLLGLMGAAGAAFPSLFMERSEESMLEGIDEFVEDRLISHMPSETEKDFPIEQMVTAIKEGMEGIRENLKFPVDELAAAIDAGFRRLPNPDRYEEVFTRAITKAADLINQKYDEFAINYERRIGELGSVLGGKLEVVATAFNANSQRLSQQLNDQSQRLAQSLTDLETRQMERMDALVEEIRRLAQQMPEEFRKAQDRYLELQAKTDARSAERFGELTEQISTMGKEQAAQFSEGHRRYMEALTELDKREISRWEKMVAEFNQLATRLAEQFRAAVDGLGNASGRYAERIGASVEALNEQLTNVKDLGLEIDKVLRTTQSVETTLRTVGNSDEFRATLANLRTHLTTSDELLRQLSRPRKVIFQEAHTDE
ncbi:MotA/TolQ/ExbB proton channel family protein [bacterium]|nr:MotA/TolQ/ExbB proton channel family protein [bacterium]